MKQHNTFLLQKTKPKTKYDLTYSYDLTTLVTTPDKLNDNTEITYSDLLQNLM